MIRIVIDDIRNVNQQEAVALGHLFMNLAGHSLHPEQLPSQTHPSLGSEEDNPANYPVLLPEVNTLTSDVNQNTLTDIFGGDTSNIEKAVLDSNGIPWDSRIHARNKSQTPSGVWKLGRNMSPQYVKQVIAELRASTLGLNSVPVPMPPVIAPTPPPVPMPPMAVATPPVPMPPVNVPTPPPAPMPQDNALPLGSANELYENLLNRVTTGMGNNTLTIATVNNILRSFKDASGANIVANLAALGTFSDEDKLLLIPNILIELDKVA